VELTELWLRDRVKSRGGKDGWQLVIRSAATRNSLARASLSELDQQIILLNSLI
jgi:hypothetical protein